MTDRLDHRRILIGADALRMMLTLALLLLALTASPGTAPVLGMAALAFLLGSAEVLRDNTAQTFLPSVVDRAQLEQANGALWSTEQLAGSIHRAAACGLADRGVGGGSLWRACGASGRGRRPHRGDDAAPPRGATGHPPLMTALREGLGWLWRAVMLRRLALLLGGFNFIGYGFDAVFMLYGQRVLGTGCLRLRRLPDACGLRRTGRHADRPRDPAADQPDGGHPDGDGGLHLAATVLALHAPLWLVAIAMVQNGFTGMLWNIAQVSYRQRHIPAPLLGRVNSAFRFIGTGPAAFGAFAFGSLIAWAAPLGTVQLRAVALCRSRRARRGAHDLRSSRLRLER